MRHEPVNRKYWFVDISLKVTGTPDLNVTAVFCWETVNTRDQMSPACNP